VPRLSDTRYSANGSKKEMKIYKQQTEIVKRPLNKLFQYMVMWTALRLKRYGCLLAWQHFFMSIDWYWRDQCIFFLAILGNLWALECDN